MNNKEIVQQVIDAFLNKDTERALAYMSEDVQIGWPGFFDLPAGKEAVRSFFTNVPELVSSQVIDLIAEGNTVAGTGTVTSRDKDGSLKNSFFCDVYELENGKVIRLKSYMVFEQPRVAAACGN
ncbi:nuclear transport factor 2 family protein [Niabella beijingensis]|uniref:nuclear transport factor 2 family protein n=1 Tax=Niabella beijingensis TaxID=2872700 RepID=UPI001CBAEE78|nr:nuclear transport factor 2 family protein [Niabella beijingensis]MBZ4188712.1 nuclear transport factor 2 family protein [Niabella beijingensis]